MFSGCQRCFPGRNATSWTLKPCQYLRVDHNKGENCYSARQHDATAWLAVHRFGNFSARDSTQQQQNQQQQQGKVQSLDVSDTEAKRRIESDEQLMVSQPKLSINQHLDQLEDYFFQTGDSIEATRMLQNITEVWLERRHSIEKLQLATNPNSNVARQLQFLPTAQEMLMRIRQSRIPPNVTTYQALIEGVTATTPAVALPVAWPEEHRSREHNLELARFAHSLLERILERVEVDLQNMTDEQSDGNGSDNVEQLDYSDISRSFRKVMSLYCHADEISTAHRLLMRLEEWEDKYPSSPTLFPIRDTNYKVVMNALAMTGRPRQAEQVLYQLLRRASSSTERYAALVRNPRSMMEALLNSWVVSCDIDAGIHTEELLAKMVELYETGLNTKPSLSSFSKAIAAWANSKHDNAAQRADDLLRSMGKADRTAENNQSGNARRTVAESHLIVMKLWSSTKDRTAPEKCRALLQLLDNSLGLANVPKLTLQKMFAALILAWARSDRPDGPANVQEIYMHMERHREPGGLFAPIGGGSNNDQPPFRWHMDVHMALLRAFARMGEGVKAETLLKRMLVEYMTNTERDSKHAADRLVNPMNTTNFNEVLLAWSKYKGDKREAARRAEKLFEHMVSNGTGVRPDLVSYKALISTLGRVNDIETARRGEDYFNRMQQHDGILPDTVAYTLVIRLWSNVPGTPEALQKAGAWLDRMKVSDNSAQPDVKTYLAFLPILENTSAHLDAAERQRRITEIECELERLGYRKRAVAKQKQELRQLLFRDLDEPSDHDSHD